MASILITGGAGFIGSHIVQLALQQSHRVMVLDNFSSGTQNNLATCNKNPALTIHTGDITQVDTYEHLLQETDHVIHCAALISVAESMQQPERYFSTNTIGTAKLYDACKKHKIKSIVFSSSAAVYGNNPTLPKTETMQVEPTSVYGITKADGEMLGKLCSKQSNTQVTSLRYFNVFGPRQNPKSSYAAAIPIFIAKAIRNEPITIFGDGLQTRDFIFVQDVARTNLFAAFNPCGVINAGSGHSITILQLAKKIIDITQSKSDIIIAPERNGDIKHSSADCSKLQALDSSLAQQNFIENLTHTIEWYTKASKVIP